MMTQADNPLGRAGAFEDGAIAIDQDLGLFRRWPTKKAIILFRNFEGPLAIAGQDRHAMDTPHRNCWLP